MARDLRRDRDAAVRITTAASSRSADIASRQRRYVISMGIRTVCFVAAVVVGAGWLRWVLVVAALLLPYVAVVMANAASSKSDGFELVDGQYGRQELSPGTESEDDTGPHPL
jgi:Mn2+/Fe2+ NRAMP family transporter